MQYEIPFWLSVEKQKKVEKALDTFISVIRLIDPRAFIQVFIEEGAPLLSLVRKVHNLLMSKNGCSTQDVDEKTLSSITFISCTFIDWFEIHLSSIGCVLNVRKHVAGLTGKKARVLILNYLPANWKFWHGCQEDLAMMRLPPICIYLKILLKLT